MLYCANYSSNNKIYDEKGNDCQKFANELWDFLTKWS
jgi:hypothetical protein